MLILRRSQLVNHHSNPAILGVVIGVIPFLVGPRQNQPRSCGDRNFPIYMPRTKQDEMGKVETMPRPRNPNILADNKIRMEEPLRAKIEAAAKENGRSMNMEMVARLER